MMKPTTREQLETWDREVVWHAFTQMAEYEPLLIERGEGCRVIDADGNSLIDGVSSLWCNVHGHRHPKLDAAIIDQLGKIAHTTQLGASNSTTIRMAKALVDVAPPNLNHVFFASDGAAAIEVALKMALQYWRQRPDSKPKKTRYLALGEAYHGDTIGSVSVGGVARFHEMFKPLLFEPLRLPVPDTYRCEDGETAPDVCARHLSYLENVLQKEHESIAAMVIEPLVQCAAGMVMHPAGYLRGVRDLTAEYDVLLIADEVAVGCGRTGKMFACEHEDVEPDFLCLGKGLTGGYLPVAATLATDEIFGAFLGSYAESKTFFHGHTFSGNPLGAAVALASLELFAEENVLASVEEKTKRLADHLARIAALPHVGDVRQRGLIAGIELVRDEATKEPYDWGEKRGFRVCNIAKRHGVLIRPLGNVVVVMPPLAISLDELDTICHAVEAGIAEATGDA